MDWASAMRDKAQGSTDAAFWRAAADEIERLQRIIDSRPAINAGLPETYIQWSQGVMQTDIAQAIGHDA